MSDLTIETCDNCQEAKKKGRAMGEVHCNKCHKSWTGVSAQHCVLCHATFSGIAAADSHREKHGKNSKPRKSKRRRAGWPTECLDVETFGAPWREVRPGVWTDSEPLEEGTFK